MKILMLFMLMSLNAFSATLGGSTLAIPYTVGGNATTPLSGASFKVQRVTLSVVPAETCKIYIGTFAGFTKEGAGNIAILFPNISGGISAEWTLTDDRNMDGIDLSTIHVSAGCALQHVQLFWYSTGNIASTLIQPVYAGAIAPSANGSPIYGGPYISLYKVQLNVIPGQGGSIFVHTDGVTPFATLTPNSGQPQSSKWELTDKNMSLPAWQIKVTAAWPGEKVLVAIWKT